MTLLRQLLLSGIAALATACSTVTDVVPDEEVLLISGNVYETLDVDYRGIFGSEDSLKEAVFGRADKFAKAQGKVASPLEARIHRVGVTADWAWFYYKFKLVDPGTPDAYRNITDIKIVRDPRLASEFYAERHQVEVASKTTDVSAEIRALDQLRKEGLITDAEFEDQKAKVLGSQR